MKVTHSVALSLIIKVNTFLNQQQVLSLRDYECSVVLSIPSVHYSDSLDSITRRKAEMRTTFSKGIFPLLIKNRTCVFHSR